MSEEESKKITVKELINELLECEMDWEVEIRDKDDCRIFETKMVAVKQKQEGLHCLFG